MSSILNHPAYRTIDVDSAITWDDGSRGHGGARSVDCGERPSKRRRIEHNTQEYLKGSPLFIASASIKGPINGDWKNPWAIKSTSPPEKAKRPAVRNSKKAAPVQSKLNLRLTKPRDGLQTKTTSPPAPLPRQARSDWDGKSRFQSGSNANDDSKRPAFTPTKASPYAKDWLRRQLIVDHSSSPPSDRLYVVDSISTSIGVTTPTKSNASTRTCVDAESVRGSAIVSTRNQESTAGAAVKQPELAGSRPPQSASPVPNAPSGFHFRQGLKGARGKSGPAKRLAQQPASILRKLHLDTVVTPNGFQYHKKRAKLAIKASGVAASTPFNEAPEVAIERSAAKRPSKSLSKQTSASESGSTSSYHTAPTRSGLGCTMINRDSQGNKTEARAAAVAMPPPPVPPAEQTNHPLRRSLPPSPDVSTQAALAQAQESFDQAFRSPADATWSRGFTPINKPRRAKSQLAGPVAAALEKASTEESCTLHPEYAALADSFGMPGTPNLHNLAMEIDFSTVQKPVIETPRPKPRSRGSSIDGDGSDDKDASVVEEQNHLSPSELLQSAAKAGHYSPPPLPTSSLNSIPAFSGTAALRQQTSAFQEHQPSLLPTPATWGREGSADIEGGLDLATDFLNTAHVENDLRMQRVRKVAVAGILKTRT